MRKNILLIAISLLMIIPIFSQDFHTGEQNQACFKDYCFNLELALTPEQRSQGLMFRESLGSEEGMLFVFKQQSKYSFWMKNTLIPLDIIWINEDQEVVFISLDTQPCETINCPLITPTENAKYVLEINSGLAEKIGLKVGEKIELEYSE